MVIKPYSDLDKPGIEFGLTYYDNPGISIPDAVTSWVAMKAMPEFLKRLREAAKGYRQYLKDSEHTRKVKDIASDVTNHHRNKMPEDNSVLETSLRRNNVSVIRPRKEATAETVVEKREGCVTNVEVMISPSTAAVQGESENGSYWKYLRPTYYFS